MESFHDIESLRHVITSVGLHCEYEGKTTKPIVKFKGTVKLHGTNGGVRVTGLNNEEVQAQGRNIVLTPEDDNYGFAKFVQSNADFFRMFAKTFGSPDVTIYGEWCGQGIQSGVAISKIGKKVFVIFDVLDHTDDSHNTGVELNDAMLAALNEVGIYLITQTQQFEVVVDFNDPGAAAELIAQMTIEVENRCPFSFDMFEVDGVGEGIVWNSYDYPKPLRFKSKGAKHKHKDKKPGVAIDPAVVEGIAALVAEVLPEWRLEQGFSFLREQKIAIDARATGEYLKWISKDILKEEQDVLDANSFEWKDIVGKVNKVAKDYFFAKLDEQAGLPSSS